MAYLAHLGLIWHGRWMA